MCLHFGLIWRAQTGQHLFRMFIWSTTPSLPVAPTADARLNVAVAVMSALESSKNARREILAVTRLLHVIFDRNVWLARMKKTNLHVVDSDGFTRNRC